VRFVVDEVVLRQNFSCQFSSTTPHSSVITIISGWYNRPDSVRRLIPTLGIKVLVGGARKEPSRKT
jgi:hypothetical protein